MGYLSRYADADSLPKLMPARGKRSPNAKNSKAFPEDECERKSDT